MPQDMTNKIMTRNMESLENSCIIQGEFLHNSRRIQAEFSTVRLVVSLLLMMVVGVNTTRGQLPTLTTAEEVTAGTQKFYLIQSAQIPSFYMIPYSTTNNVSTSNVPCEAMRWYFMASGEDGYYFIRHNTSGDYLSCAAGVIQLEDLSEGTPGDSHKFSIEATGDYYYIKPKETTSYVTKKNGNVNPTDYIKANATADGANSQWKFIASNAISWGTPDWLTTDDNAKKYYRIKNAVFDSYYLSKNAVTNTTTSETTDMVCTSNSESDDNMVWYFKAVPAGDTGSDSYITYYYIIHAETGKYMCFDGDAAKASENQKDAASLQEKNEENEQKCQFVVVRTARTEGSGAHQKVIECYSIIPKLLKGQIWANNSIALVSDKNNTNVYTKSDRTDTNNRAHWIFEAVTCADPVIAFDETEGKVTLTSATTGASIYYTVATGTTTPADPTATTGTPYTDGIALTENVVTTVKAIAVKGYGKSQVASIPIYYMPTFTLIGGPYTYDGTAKEPTVSGDVTIGTPSIAIAAADYVLEYKDNVNAGTAKVILREVKGKDKMIYGSQTFSIAVKPLDDGNGAIASGFSVVIDTNNGLVLHDGETELVADVDYEVGEASTSGQVTTRTVQGKGNYAGAQISLSNTSGITFHTDALQSEWSATFVSSADYALPDESVNAFIITDVQDEWAIAKLLPYIPRDVPVLVVSNKETNGFLVGTPSGDAPDCSANLLKVRNAALADVLAGKIYWLYNNEFVLNMAGEIPAGKVYLNPNNFDDSQLTGGSSTPTPAPARLSIRRSESTGINEIAEDRKMNAENSIWYTLDGRRLNGKPTQKGLYITKDRKVIIKR